MKIGIIGGGQLALMLIQSSKEHEYYVLEPKIENSVLNVANIINKKYDNAKGLKMLLDNCNVITYEFENVPISSLSIIKKKLFPNINLLKISQNRILEKGNARKLNIPTAEFYIINNIDQLKEIIERKNSKWILKTTTNGYDGKNQIIIKDTFISDEIIKMINKNKCILEKFIDFNYETSLIMTRDKNGCYVYLNPTKNINKNNMLWITHNLDDIDYLDTIVKYTNKIMDELDVVGTLAVEFFITKNGPVFNEMAPRPHNSGHWSIEGSTASQFLNHINAITDKKLIKPINIGYTAMINLIGNHYLIAKDKIDFNNNIVLHDYFKDKIKEGRKMGHITINYPTKELLKSKLKKIQNILY